MTNELIIFSWSSMTEDKIFNELRTWLLIGSLHHGTKVQFMSRIKTRGEGLWRRPAT